MKIKEQELKTIQDQQTKLNELEIGRAHVRTPVTA